MSNGVFMAAPGLIFSSSIPAGATTEAREATGFGYPVTVWLRSSNASRAIAISIDGASEYFQPIYDYSSATELGVVLNAPVSHVRVTGAAADTWGAR